MKERMKIGFDIDGVLADTIFYLLRWHNETYGTAFTLEDIRKHDLWELWGGTKEEAVKKFNAFCGTQYFLDITPVPGSQEALSELAPYSVIFALSDRSPAIYKETMTFLSKYFPHISPENVLLIGGYENLTGRKKSHLCKELGLKALVEDYLKNAIWCARNGTRILLLDKPWNREEEMGLQGVRSDEELAGMGVERVVSWPDIVERIKEMY